MLKALGYRIILAVAACLLLVQPSIAADQARKNLVSVQWLQEHRTDADVVVLDASPAQIYGTKHIPGALAVDIFLTYGAAERSLADAERLYQSWGVSPGKKVVVYDQGGTFLATRLFFALYYHGFPVKDLLVLDGGLSRWQQDGMPVTADITPAVARGSFRITTINEDVRVRLPEFLAASGNPANHVLLEALGPDWHFGEVVAFEKGGHIPNAVLMPSADFFNPDKTFKSAAEIRRQLAYLGIRPEQTIHSHCGGGVAASVPFFALKFLAGYPTVKLFVESQLGWQSDGRDLPYWTYDVPSLMRHANWLQGWGGQMMRTYAGGRVSVVDVRPPEAFGLGHVPFALNIPAEIFRSHLATPETLADILGAAGVDVASEALVISGAGLSKDAALAFVMLEKLGQQRVSVLVDAVEKWERPGFAMTKAATLVGPKKGPFDVSIPPTTYPATVRKDVIIADPMSTRGLYPKVFVASGAKLPATSPDGQVVHVPYTELVGVDGSPKAAKDIWNILVKAGVPRYAELVCYSDDPGEAAVNYVILRLMGYPDIKMLVL